MSLISEALRKAQLEALQQDREQRRFYMTHAGRAGHPATGPSRVSIAIVILASLCVLSAGALLYLTLNRNQPRPVAAPVADVTRPAAPAIDTAAGAPATVARAEKVAPPAEKAKRAAPRSGSRKSSVSTPTQAEARPRDRTTQPSAFAEAPRTTSRRLERDGFREGETYGSPVLGPFGTEVVLTGITALRGQHVAIINGNTLRAGTAVGPFVIEEIEARRVRLKYVDITFYVVQ